MVANEGTTFSVIASPTSTSPQVGVVASISGAKVVCQLGEHGGAKDRKSVV